MSERYCNMNLSSPGVLGLGCWCVLRIEGGLWGRKPPALQISKSFLEVLPYKKNRN